MRTRATVLGLPLFLGSPSMRAGMTNGDVIESVVGASVGKPAVDVVDPATYDGVQEDRESRTCRTFREAFRALRHNCGRDWTRFDIAALRALHPDFAALRLPEAVEDRIVEEEIAEYYAFTGDGERALSVDDLRVLEQGQ